MIHSGTKESERGSAGAAKSANLLIHNRVAKPEAGRQQLRGDPAQRFGRAVPAAALQRSRGRVLTPLRDLRQKGASHARLRHRGAGIYEPLQDIAMLADSGALSSVSAAVMEGEPDGLLFRPLDAMTAVRRDEDVITRP